VNDHYTLVFPARPEYLLLARLALTGVARLAPVDEEALADLRLAVTEVDTGGPQRRGGL